MSDILSSISPHSHSTPPCLTLGEIRRNEENRYLTLFILLKDLQVFYGGAKKADWDVGLAVDAITAAPKLDTVILVTGDGDFVPLVQYLQTHGGCQVEVVSFGRSTSGKLKEAADDFLDLDEDPRRYIMGFRGGARRAAPRGDRSAPDQMPDEMEKEMGVE